MNFIVRYEVIIDRFVVESKCYEVEETFEYQQDRENYQENQISLIFLFDTKEEATSCQEKLKNFVHPAPFESEFQNSAPFLRRIGEAAKNLIRGA